MNMEALGDVGASRQGLSRLAIPFSAQAKRIKFVFLGDQRSALAADDGFAGDCIFSPDELAAMATTIVLPHLPDGELQLEILDAPEFFAVDGFPETMEGIGTVVGSASAGRVSLRCMACCWPMQRLPRGPVERRARCFFVFLWEMDDCMSEMFIYRFVLFSVLGVDELFTCQSNK